MPQIEGVYARCHSSQEKASKDSLIISNVCCDKKQTSDNKRKFKEKNRNKD